jgi:hypothetical protein
MNLLLNARLKLKTSMNVGKRMTRKDYDMLAACIGASLAESLQFDEDSRQRATWERAVQNVARRIANELGLDNPRFDANRFEARVQHYLKKSMGV